MKTIFITLASGQEITNFLTGDFYRLAKAYKDVRLVFFLPGDQIKKYKSQFAHERCLIESIPPVDLEWKPKKIFRIACFGCIPTRTIWSRNLFSYYNGGSLFGLVGKQILWCLGHLKAWRHLMRLAEYHIFREDRLWKAYFDTYKPEVGFGTGMIAEEDITMVKYAKRHGIPTVGMMRGWDNFTSKGFLRVHPDILLVQNQSMIKEARDLNSFPKNRIRVVGFPRWDHYLDHEWHMSKEEFAAKFNLDPHKRWIVYFGGGLLLGLFNLPETGDHVSMLNRAIQRGEIANACTIIRPHPSYTQYLSREARKSPVLAFGKGWDFVFDELKLLLNLVRLSDVTLNLGSTMALEAAIFDKPSILISFTGFVNDAQLPWHRRPSVALDDTVHYQIVEKTGGVWRVYNERELVQAVKTYLEKPELHRDGRKRIVEELVGPLDGKAGQRAFEIVIDQLKKIEN